MQEKHRANQKITRRKKENSENTKKKKTKQQNNYKRGRDLRKEGRELLVVSPQARDQSKRVPLKDASI